MIVLFLPALYKNYWGHNYTLQSILENIVLKKFQQSGVGNQNG